MPTAPQLFLSYRTRLAASVRPLVDALQAHGVTVWYDQRIGRAASITAELREALANSQALAVFASADYPESPICAWELASAWSAAARIGEEQRRVLFLQPNDQRALDYRRFGALADSCAFSLPSASDHAALMRCAEALAQHLHGLDPRPLGALLDLTRAPRWYPYARAGSSRFVGRMPALWQLHALLTRARMVGITGATGRDLAQLRGLGGIGKTLLAIEYARRFESSWPGGIFWVDADPSWGAAPASEAERLRHRQTMLAGFASTLDVTPIAGDLGATAAAVERALAAHTAGERFLWIVDNLPPGTDQRMVEALLPASPAGALLLTTRWMALQALPEPLDLGVLDAIDAFTLLTSRRPPVGADEIAAAHALALDVGHHPLALDVLGALLQRELSSAPYARWRGRLAAPDDRFTRAADGLLEQLPTGCERAITRVLASSYDRLHEQLAREVLNVAAYLGDAPIPGDLLVDVLARLGHVDDDAIHCAVDELASHALVAYEATIAGIRVHAVVRWCARRWAPPRPGPGPEITRIEAELCEVLCQRLRSADDLHAHDQLLQLVPHIEAVSRLKAGEAVILGASLGHFFEVRGDFRGARAHAERALRFFEGLGGPPSEYSALAKNNLGVALRGLGDLASAEQAFGASLIDYERCFGEAHPKTLMALHNLATIFEAQGDYAATRRIYERVLPIQVYALGPRHRDTVRTRMHLGGILSELGDHVESRRILEDVVRECEVTFGTEDAVTLQSHGHLAVARKRLGDYAGARAIEEDIYARKLRLLGPEHPQTLMSGQQLATTLSLQGDGAGAQALYEEILEIRIRVQGREHIETLAVQSCLTTTLIQVGDLDRAQALGEEVHVAQQRILGPTHPHTLLTLWSLASICHDRGDLQGAREHFEAVVAGRTASLGPQHSDTLSSRVLLAETNLRLGERDGAREQVLALEADRGRLQRTNSPIERGTSERLSRLEKALAAPAGLLSLGKWDHFAREAEAPERRRSRRHRRRKKEP